VPARMEDRGQSPAPLDPLLRPLVEAASEEERRELQAEIVSLVQPIIRNIVRRRLRGFAQGGGQDADDIEADVLVSLLGRIEDVVPPLAPSPIQDASLTAGDGTQPAWTARHAELEALAPGHVISIKSPSADHAALMNLPNTLQAIAGILGIP